MHGFTPFLKDASGYKMFLSFIVYTFEKGKGEL